MRRRTFIASGVSAAVVAATLPLPEFPRICLSCGAPTDVHLIDCTHPLGSPERNRTVCFACTPEARV
jgi:hypothetical protein